MDSQQIRISETWLKWIIFLTVLTAVAAWAVRGVLVRAQQMSAADTTASTFASISPGSSAKAVVRIDSVKGKELKAILLEKQSDTVYLLPSERTPAVNAVLTPDTSVVMGKPEQIVVGAVVQLAGTIDANHVLQTDQVVILTGYVRVSEKAR
jgi:Kef-type K+ transport system membrane component KefB